MGVKISCILSPFLLYCVYKKHRKYNTMDKMQLKALAKINLGLDVLRKREDGYHDVRMIMQTVRIFDRLQLVKKESGSERISTICPPMKIIWYIRLRICYLRSLTFRADFPLI